MRLFVDNLIFLLDALGQRWRQDRIMRLQYFVALSSILKVCAKTKMALSLPAFEAEEIDFQALWQDVYNEIEGIEVEAYIYYMVEEKLRFYSDTEWRIGNGQLPMHVDTVINAVLARMLQLREEIQAM